MKRNVKQNNRSVGAVYEQAAGYYLEQNGYELIEYNYRCRDGEIDIIAKNSEFIAFVEVKARNEKALERPAAAVTSAKRRKIIQTALIFLSEFEYDLQPRFDVCEITIDNRTNMLIELNYIENAFDTEGVL